MRSVTEHTAEAPERGPRTLTEMAELVGERGHTTNQRRWDRLVEQWLADQPRPAVRLWSAGAVLFWDPEAARATLTAIRDFPAQFDLHSITAKHTLLEFDAGTLERGGRLPGT
jgi:hypothetical protein